VFAESPNALQALTASEGRLAHVKIESALRCVQYLVGITQGNSLSPQILEARARLMARLGDATTSNRLMYEALAKYREIGATGHAAQLSREIGP
jgi:hypothetical protein